MENRKLGAAGLGVSALGLGCMGMAGAYGTADTDEAVATVRRALDLGVTLIDTADFYGPGTAEKIVATALEGRRDEAVVATKFGMRRPAAGPPYVDGSPAYVREACEASLQRMGLDHIDLYYLARLDPKVDVEETVGALGELVAEGKVRHIGLCEVSARTLRRANAVHPIAALQTEYSLWERHVEAEILPTCRELGTGFVAYSPLGRGFLTGAFDSAEDLAEDDQRRNHPRFQSENFDHNRNLVRTVEELAKEKGVSLTQLALAWVLAQGGDIVPIPGTRRVSHLEQNVSAADVRLTEEEVARLSDLFPAGATAGLRYPAHFMRTIDQS
ncbi:MULTISPECIES: aldo/keto reductase [unclassified Streptomyces]|uniref:aldo/keto reductase n=1 Tax=unclassified Streptomyces TaxID=2593676 RepID=UPI002E122784|nr:MULTISPECIES: aldo/keto reductase [unclassified Streptomyces]WSQ81071.1 aldo/keto reductase [Streptomyces sp. NBC_01213]WSQ88401.1 aldo/keto reductase [Streptomyces sp. NBC_01212]WSR05592.1 aldo/keto reductase [Streptomyces sp. NBC_01208]WSR51797.1 aldo/keto reductase [Streptomyces sp. NBC_01201]